MRPFYLATRVVALAVIVAMLGAACSSSDSQIADVVAPDAQANSDSDTPLISEQDWIAGRLTAAQQIWGFTDDGVEWQNSYDFRQMRGQPAWFGSTGSNGYAGAGQAIPHSVLHELGHSYWGAFPVDGAPDLLPGTDVDQILESYQDDLLAFMRQAPDRFEPLRDRFRNLPNLDRGELPDLVHFGESELIYFTGGDLDLIPPILRKYYTAYLDGTGVAGDEQELEDWPAALSWWFGLDDGDRSGAGSVFGLQHFPLNAYTGLTQDGDATLNADIVSLIRDEEKQRIVDFADQFDEIKERRSSVTDATGTDRGFNFWARYLRDLFELHADHPEVLADATGVRGRELGIAFDAYREIDPLSPPDQAEQYRALTSDSGLVDTPGDPRSQDVRDFAPLLKARTLLELFPAETKAGSEGIEAAASAYASELRGLVAIADAALAVGANYPQAAAAELEVQLSDFSDDELAGRIDTIFGTMRDAELEIARNVIAVIPNSLLIRLLDVRPSAARVGEITPQRLLGVAGVTTDTEPDALVVGIALLAENSSGNFAIDAPFDEAIYDVLDSFAANDPGLILKVFRETDLRPLPWISGHAETAASVFGGDVPSTVGLLTTLDGPEPTPERILRALAYHDASSSVELMLAALDAEQGQILTDTLNAIVYDAYWSELGAGPDGRLRSAAALLLALRDRVGEERAVELVVAGVVDYLRSVSDGDLEAEYRTRHLETMDALSDAASVEDDRLFFESLSIAIRHA
jgi:hypothetical protein